MAVGAARPEFSGYLLLDVPEISLPGPVEVVVSSELPGTTQLVLLRQFPEPMKLPSRSTKDVRKQALARPEPAPAPARKIGPTTASPPPVTPTVLVAAAQIAPGHPPSLSAKFNFQRNERLTLLAFAQGRWFATTREMKLAKQAQ